MPNQDPTSVSSHDPQSEGREGPHGDGQLMNINVTICERPYRLKVKPSEEEYVRLAAKMINDKVKDLQSQYSAKDKQDYLAMATLMFQVEKLTERGDYVIKDPAMQERLTALESRLDQLLTA